MNNQSLKYDYLPLQAVVAMGWSLFGFAVFSILSFVVNQSWEMDGVQLFGLSALNAFITFIIIIVLEMETKKGLFLSGAIPILVLGCLQYLWIAF